MNNIDKKRMMARQAARRRNRAALSPTVNNRSLYEQKKAMYNRIMSEIVPLIQKELNESNQNDELNELFGFGKKEVAEPAQAITADFIKEASTEDLAVAMAEQMNYWMAKAGENVDKAIMSTVAQIHDICKDSVEAAEKVCTAIVVAIKKALSFTLNATIDGVKGLGRLLLMGISFLVKLGNNGIKFAAEALPQAYNTIVKFLQNTYNALKKEVENKEASFSDKANVFFKVVVAGMTLVANKVVGAVETIGKWVKEIYAEAKENVVMAIAVVRTWFAMKSEKVAAFIKESAGDIKESVVKAWNALEKGLRKSWKTVTEKVLAWIADVKDSFNNLKEKISGVITKAGDKIIQGRDKMLVAGINKAVGALKKNYSEDDIVSMVRKAYNEGITFEADGSCILNECYYSSTYLRQI